MNAVETVDREAPAGGDWNEEFDAWLELIEDHLKSIRRMMVFILAVVLISTISVVALSWVLLRTILMPSTGF